MTDRSIRVMVVDDSAVVRGIWARILDAEDDIRVVASAWNGKATIDILRRRKDVDVVVLDIEMPEMSGLEALPILLRESPHIRVIMASSLTRKGAEVTINALALGAADYVTKPSASEGGSLKSMGEDLVRKVRALGGRRLAREGWGTPPPPPATPPAPHIIPARAAPRALVVAASTGGPNALTTFLAGLPVDFPLPIFIVQHMPPLFTTMLAERLARASGRTCVEAVDGMDVVPGTTYVAPGGHHMTLEDHGAGRRIRLNQDPPENFCRPSADQLFRSAAHVYGPALTAVVLTGMGHDGLEGARVVAGRGGAVVAQDRDTSVVWGMPGAVVGGGLAGHVLPLGDIASFIDDLVGVRR